MSYHRSSPPPPRRDSRRSAFRHLPVADAPYLLQSEGHQLLIGKAPQGTITSPCRAKLQHPRETNHSCPPDHRDHHGNSAGSTGTARHWSPTATPPLKIFHSATLTSPLTTFRSCRCSSSPERVRRLVPYFIRKTMPPSASSSTRPRTRRSTGPVLCLALHSNRAHRPWQREGDHRDDVPGGLSVLPSSSSTAIEPRAERDRRAHIGA